MPQDNYSDIGALRTQLSPGLDKIPDDTVPTGLGQFRLPAASRDSGADSGNFLQKAVDAATPPSDQVSQGDPAAARNRLAQEALLANPAEMRKEFPNLLKDLDSITPFWSTANLDRSNGFLNYLNLDSLLQDPKLSQNDKNLLTVFQANVPLFSQIPDNETGNEFNLVNDDRGISADSLAVLDKALNRNIPEDPFRKHLTGADWLEPFVLGGVAGGVAGNLSKNPATFWIAVGVGAVSSAVIYELDIWHKSKTPEAQAEEAKAYDTEKSNYLAFVKDFKKTQSEQK